MDTYATILYFLAFIAIFYFMIIRPQQQRQKQQQNTVNSLKPNMNVTTYAGILGKVVKVKENTIILKVADNVEIEMLKTAVAYLNKDEK